MLVVLSTLPQDNTAILLHRSQQLGSKTPAYTYSLCMQHQRRLASGCKTNSISRS